MHHRRRRCEGFMKWGVRASRSSERALALHELSISIWELNTHLFRQTDLRLGNLPEPARASLAFPSCARLENVCSWHAERLNGRWSSAQAT